MAIRRREIEEVMDEIQLEQPEKREEVSDQSERSA